MDYRQITGQVCLLCKEVGHYISEQAKLLSKDQIQSKGLHDVVSYVDCTSEEKLKSRLSELVPESGFIAEESGNQVADIYNWIIDPLDGTTNFVHHIPFYSISIALQENEETVIGVVYEVNRNECFYSWKGGDAFLNDNKISVSEEANLENSLLATGFPFRDFTKIKGYLSVLESVMKETQGIRRCGSAALDLAYVACGRFEAFFEYALHSWDIAAGAFLVKQAGGKVSTWNGYAGHLTGKEILAGNPSIHSILLHKLSNQFYHMNFRELIGYSITPLCPNGKVLIENKIFNATAISGYLETEEPIKVISYRSGEMIVDKI
jgi:Archaeal fructose-1,6-bisphosphatase and related enzymes of inositol monophosphatase family